MRLTLEGCYALAEGRQRNQCRKGAQDSDAGGRRVATSVSSEPHLEHERRKVRITERRSRRDG
jgi:hypothetical protein